jgi:hypothetical protein
VLKELKTLRLGYSDAARPLYDQLVSAARERPEDAPFLTQKDLFMAAACMGAKLDEYKEVAGPNRNIQAGVLDESVDIPVLIALAYKKLGNVDSLSNARDIVRTAEGWAEGGIWHLKRIILDEPGVSPLLRLVDLVVEKEDAGSG